MRRPKLSGRSPSTASRCGASTRRDLEHARSLALRGSERRRDGRRPQRRRDGGAIADVLRPVPGAAARRAPRRARQRSRARPRRYRLTRGRPVRTSRRASPREMDVGEVLAEGAEGPAGRSWASPPPASTATPTVSPTKRPSWLGGLVYAYGALRALAGVASRALRDRRSSPRASATRASATPSSPPTRRRTAAECAWRRRRCSTTACSRYRDRTGGQASLPVAPAEGVQGRARAAAPCEGVSRPGGRHLRGPPVHDVCRRRPHRRAAAARARGARCGPRDRAAGAERCVRLPLPALSPTAPRRSSRAPARRARTPGPGADGRSTRAEARARTRRGRHLAPPRRWRHERARQAAAAPGPRRDRRARRPPAAGKRAAVSATNGKTTTAAMAADDPRARRDRARAQPAPAPTWRAAWQPRCWRAARGDGGIDGELGLFEVDEMWLARIAAELHPRAIAARQPVPRPARPLRRARDDRRELGATRSSGRTRRSC